MRKLFSAACRLAIAATERASTCLAVVVLLSTSTAISASAAAPDGAALFSRHCAGCHGSGGAGDGPAAYLLFPRPRNFLEQPFKFGGTHEDIARTVGRGIPGTSMPAFAEILSNDELDAVAAHVVDLAGDNAIALPVEPFEVPSPVGDPKRGRALYVDGCANCHGESGRGDGPSAPFLTDDFGLPIRPANLPRGIAKGGSSAAELFIRISAGLPGTPMPGYAEALPERDRWDLVAYLLDLMRNADRPSGSPEPLRARVVPALPDGPMEQSWRALPATTVALDPLWQRPEWPPSVTARAAHDGTTLALLVEWNDPTADRAPGSLDDFLDAVAAMVPAQAGPVPFIGMGLGDDVARILHWRAVTPPQPQQFAGLQAHAIRDANPLEGRPEARPAQYVGNPVAAHRPHGAPGYEVLELVAAGPGTITPVAPDHAHTKAKAVWADGRWHVQFERPLAVADGDVSLPPGTRTHVAFAVWDGSAGDRNGQKSITQWIPMEVER